MHQRLHTTKWFPVRNRHHRRLPCPHALFVLETIEQPWPNCGWTWNTERPRIKKRELIIVNAHFLVGFYSLNDDLFSPQLILYHLIFICISFLLQIMNIKLLRLFLPAIVLLRDVGAECRVTQVVHVHDDVVVVLVGPHSHTDQILTGYRSS